MNPKNLFIDSGLNIPLNELESYQLKQIMDDLTIYFKDYYSPDKKVNKTIFYELTNEYLRVPRNYIQHPDIVNNTIEGKSINIKPKKDFEFRDEIQKEASNKIIDNDCITIKLPPGKGKTVIGSVSVARLDKSALILVDQITLKEQWEEAFLQFTNIKKKDFGNISKLKLGKINIFTIQALYSKIKKDKDKIHELFKNSNIGITIFDEVHCLLGPEKFTQVAMLCYSKKIIGLSATPYSRHFKKKQILLNWLTDKIYENKEYDLSPTILKYEIQKVNTKEKGKGYVYSKFKRNSSGKYVFDRFEFDRTKYFKKLHTDNEYIKLLCTIIQKAYVKKRSILVLSHLTKMLDNIKAELKKLGFKKHMIGCFYGTSKKEETEKQIVLATYKKCEKGVNIPVIDTLLLSQYIHSEIQLEQSVGRILRLNNEKAHPVVFDFVDTAHKRTLEAWENRLKFYRDMEFEIIDLKTNQKI